MFWVKAQHQTEMRTCDAKCLDMCIVLTHPSNKSNVPSHWEVRIDSNVHADALKEFNIKQID